MPAIKGAKGKALMRAKNCDWLFQFTPYFATLFINIPVQSSDVGVGNSNHSGHSVFLNVLKCPEYLSKMILL